MSRCQVVSFALAVASSAIVIAGAAAAPLPGKEVAFDVGTGRVSGPDARADDVAKPKALYMTVQLKGGAKLFTATGTVTCVKGSKIAEKTYDTTRAGLLAMKVVPAEASICSVSAQATGSGTIRVAIRVVR